MTITTKRHSKHTILAVIMALAVCGSAGYTNAEIMTYEPFEYSFGSLGGNGGATGLDGNWLITGNVLVTNSTLYYGSLSITGQQARLTDNSRSYVSTGTDLLDAGLLDDGATLWVSLLVRSSIGTGVNNQQSFAFGTDPLKSGGFGMPMDNSGDGVGFTLDRGQRFHPAHWTNGVRVALATGTTSPGVTNFAVLKIEWGATGADKEVITFYRPGRDLVLPAPSEVVTTREPFDQSTFDILSYSHRSGNYDEIDEIRFGATYENVIGIPDPLVGMVILVK